jgi:stalled ribosome rescue protein Dom34
MAAVHFLVWIDHQRARLIQLTNGETTAIRLGSDAPPGAGGSAPRAPSADAQLDLFEDVADTISDAAGVVIAGPGNDRQALSRHLKTRHPAIGSRIIAVEQMGQATDTMLRTYARTYFRLSDRPRSM